MLYHIKIGCLIFYFDRFGDTHRLTVIQKQVLKFKVYHCCTTALGFEHHCKASVFMRLNARNGVHNYADGIVHSFLTLDKFG